jgi:DNA polymerase III delta prime subunit
MHSFLICSGNKETGLEFAKGECERNQIDKFDINTLSFRKSIGIEDIRTFQKQVFLKPIKSKTKAVILDGALGITIEAQNALLKILEEPPSNTIIYITIPNKDLVLPTILSRCKVVELKDKDPKVSRDEITQYLNILISLRSSGIGNRLKLAQDIAKTKEAVIPWLEKMTLTTRQTMLVQYSNEPKTRDQRPETKDYISILISLQKTHTVLKTTNVNPRLTLENLFLNL